MGKVNNQVEVKFTEDQEIFIKSCDGLYLKREDILKDFKQKFDNDITLSQLKNKMNNMRIKLKPSLSKQDIIDFINENSNCKIRDVYNEIRANKNRWILELTCDCGTPFEAEWSKFKLKNKRQCKECSFKNSGIKRRSEEEIVKSKILKDNPNIIFLSPYTTGADNGRFKCSIDNHIWQTTWNNLLNKHGCRKCADKLTSDRQRITLEFIFENLPKVNKHIKLITQEFENSKDLLIWKCLKCGKHFGKNWNNIQNGQQCTHCSFILSKGEDKIEKWLCENNIDYEKQFKFDDCLSDKNRKLKFDFYFEKENLAIEYDGEQHSSPVAFSGDWSKAESNFKRIQRYDKIKDNYCLYNDIKLIRIPYTEFNNVESLLADIFIKESE